MGLYNEGKQLGGNDFTGNTIKVALLTASYTPDKDHTGYAAISPYELGTSGTNYTAGGIALSTKSIDIDNTNDLLHFLAGDVNYPTLNNGSVRYASIYDETDDILIRWLDFTTTRTLNGGDIDVGFSNSRILTRT